MSLTRRFALPVLACAAWLSAGCGSTAVPVRAQSDAIAAATAAREVGAENTPEAWYHLELADDQVRQAQVLIREGRMEAAQRVLERAKLDAELAQALQREAQVRTHTVSMPAQPSDQTQRHDTDGR
jgi:hypothetical protein